MKKLISNVFVLAIMAMAVPFAVTNSAWWVNKPKAPTSLIK